MNRVTRQSPQTRPLPRLPRAYRLAAGGGGGRWGGEGDPGEYSPSYDEQAEASRSEYEVVPDWLDVLEFTLQRPNLADAFFKVTGRALRDDDAAPADGA